MKHTYLSSGFILFKDFILKKNVREYVCYVVCALSKSCCCSGKVGWYLSPAHTTSGGQPVLWLMCSSWTHLLPLDLLEVIFFPVLCSRCRCSSQLCFPSRVSSWLPFPCIPTHLVQELASSLLWLGFLHTISLLYGTRNPSGLEECQVRLLHISWPLEGPCCRKPIYVYIHTHTP